MISPLVRAGENDLTSAVFAILWRARQGVAILSRPSSIDTFCPLVQGLCTLCRFTLACGCGTLRNETNPPRWRCMCLIAAVRARRFSLRSNARGIGMDALKRGGAHPKAVDATQSV